MKKLLLMAVLVAGAVGCASAQARSPADHPNLEVPPVPPRVIEALPIEAPADEPVQELPPVAAVSPRPRAQPAARDTAKPEVKTPETAQVEPAPPPAAPPPAPAPQLRTPGMVDGAEAARQIHDLIERAKRGLGAIDYRQLSTERRSQYDSARLMVTQAEDAVKASNFEFARNLAEKADRLATELRSR